MKIDYDLIRDLLLEIEEWVGTSPPIPYDWLIQRNNHKDKDVAYWHLKYLLRAGYVVGDSVFIKDISPQGIEYLNSIRDESVWEYVKSKIRTATEISFPVIYDLATDYIKTHLGM